MIVRTHPTGGVNLRSLPRAGTLRDVPPSPDPGSEKPPGNSGKPSTKPKNPHAKQSALGGHIGLESGEHAASHLLGAAKSSLVDLKTEAHGAASDAVDTALGSAGQIGHAAHTGMSTAMELATSTLGFASGALGFYMLSSGIHDMRIGLASKSGLHTVEGANTMVVGVRSLAAGVNLASHLLPEVSWLNHAGHLAKQSLAPLGIFHGTVDAAIGIHEVVQGVRKQNNQLIGAGVLGIGTGVALAAAAAGGGLPALMTAGAFLAGKVAHAIYYPHDPHSDPDPTSDDTQPPPTGP